VAESERTRTREREPVPPTSYEDLLRDRRAFDDRQREGPVVIKPGDRTYETTRQGRILYYMNELAFKDVPLQDWLIFSHDLRTHSGKHRHQGGLVIYVIEGTGWSIVDDERVDWSAGDLLLLPIKPGGVEHQHFNAAPGTPCTWIAFVYMPIMDYLAMEMVQMTPAPDFRG